MFRSLCYSYIWVVLKIYQYAYYCDVLRQKTNKTAINRRWLKYISVHLYIRILCSPLWKDIARYEPNYIKKVCKTYSHKKKGYMFRTLDNLKNKPKQKTSGNIGHILALSPLPSSLRKSYYNDWKTLRTRSAIQYLPWSIYIPVNFLPSLVICTPP